MEAELAVQPMYMYIKCEEAKIFYHIILSTFREIRKCVREISGNSQGKKLGRLWEPCIIWTNAGLLLIEP